MGVETRRKGEEKGLEGRKDEWGKEKIEKKGKEKKGRKE